MGVEELLHELLVNEDVKFNGLDASNHIRINTNNYEIICIEHLYYVLWEFMFKNVNMKYKGKTYNLQRLDRAYYNGEQLDDINFNDYSVWDKEIGDGYDDIFDDDEPDDEPDDDPDDDPDNLSEDNETNNISEVLELTRMFMTARNLRHMNKGMFFEYEQGMERIESYINSFVRVFIAHGVKIAWSMEDLNRGSKYVKYAKKQTMINKQPLTFLKLFKNEYRVFEKMQLFYSRLENNGFIDKDKNWRDDPRKGNEPAKVYFWLLDKGVMQTANDDTNALICFCKEFGITVYRDTEPTPPADVRKITTKNLLKVKGKITPDEKKRFEQVFSPYLIKQLVP